MKICRVCEQQPPKYRCPRCGLRYCSVGCYKKHKDDCKPQESGSVTTISELSPVLKGIMRQDGKAESEELKSLLCNPHLRQLLLTVDKAEDKESIMKTAMQEPIFVEFADRCLQTVEPPEKENEFLTS
ncbi:zinc finger HIT domain-containing protein 3 isoform X5 [Heptranchias perlo]|uniref:zinc finger HIT domain-containing protein 3 isoform X5 n=1 Tax=Heptranchias perlo TaxID=212740 RepID=UPI003559A14A